MYLADKIILLRKKAGLTQEELAELLEVSRQSISKWENGTSIPDMEKIIRLSDVFHVSTDALLREDLSVDPGDEPVETPIEVLDYPTLFPVSLEFAQDFLQDTLWQSKKIALGVLCFILSPALLIFLSIVAEAQGHSEALSFVFGFIALAALIVFGLHLVISASLQLKPYEPLRQEPLDTAYGVEGLARRELETSAPGYVRHLITAIGLFLLSPVPIILIDYLDPESALASATSIVLLLVIISIGVYLLVPAAAYRGALQQLLETDDYTRKKKANLFPQLFAQIYWPIITAIYLCYSLLTNDWGRSWIIWPVAAVLSSGLAVIFHHLGHKKIKGHRNNSGSLDFILP